MNLFVPLILIGVLVIIAGLLALADLAIGGGGEKSLTINGKKKIPIKSPDTILNTLNNNKIFIPSACGGKATCGFCKVKVLEGGGELKPTEEPFMSAQEKDEGIRLSCQVRINSNVQIQVPEGMMEATEFKALVEKITDLTYDIKLIRFKLIEPDTMFFRPGQYAQLKVPGIGVIRAYSIASDRKDENHIELIIREVPKGQATSFVHRAMEVGDNIFLTGPYGDFYLQEDSKRDIVCIAGGSGKAPIRSILFALRDQGMPRKVKYFFGARSKRDLYMTEEFDALQKEFPNFEYIPALSDPLDEDNWEGEVGLITDVLDRNVDDLSEHEAYLCGSPGMIKACINVLEKHDIKDENVYFDNFS